MNNECLFVAQVSATASTIIKTPHIQSAIISHMSTSTSINPSSTLQISASCPSSSLALPPRKTYPLLMLTEPPFVDPTVLGHTGQLQHTASGGSPGSPFDLPTPPTSAKSLSSSGRGSTRRPKAVHDIGCLPEGQPLDMTTVTHRGVSGSGRPPPSPLNVLACRQVS